MIGPTLVETPTFRQGNTFELKWLRCLRVFADKSTEDRSSVAHVRRRDYGRWGLVDGKWKLMSALMGPMLVIVRVVLAECGEQVAFAVHEHAVEALAARGTYPPLRVGVTGVDPERLGWCAHLGGPASMG